MDWLPSYPSLVGDSNDLWKATFRPSFTRADKRVLEPNPEDIEWRPRYADLVGDRRNLWSAAIRSVSVVSAREGPARVSAFPLLELESGPGETRVAGFPLLALVRPGIDWFPSYSNIVWPARQPLFLNAPKSPDVFIVSPADFMHCQAFFPALVPRRIPPAREGWYDTTHIPPDPSPADFLFCLSYYPVFAPKVTPPTSISVVVLGEPSVRFYITQHVIEAWLPDDEAVFENAADTVGLAWVEVLFRGA